MAEQNSPPNDDRPLIRRGRVDIVDLYEVQEAELQILEKGSSATLLFNIAIFLLSSAFTCVAALVTSDFKWQIAETIFIFFSLPIDDQGTEKCWRWGKDTFAQRKAKYIEVRKTKTGYVVYSKQYENEYEGEKAKTIWNKPYYSGQTATQVIKTLFGNRVFSYPKSPYVIRDVLEITTKPGDIILDFFAGSGTTAAVAHKMNRQWITVEQMDYVETITMERLKKVIGKRVKAEGKLLEEIEYDTGRFSKSVNWQGGGDFIYCELMPYNQAYINKIQAAQSSEELVTLWRDVAENSFLNWYVNKELPTEAVDDFIEIGKGENGLEKQKQLLVELLDKNQLYVNLSEIDDADFGVSEEDKALNRAFYGDASQITELKEEEND